ncbi:MAG: pallilysin-related adhesin [Treponema sp.]|jgi:hypothetical protein|nr:pallilysin-related adhesin [Treponema sp.]
MTKKILLILSVSLLFFCMLGIALLVFNPFNFNLVNLRKPREQRQTRIVIPQEIEGNNRDSGTAAERTAYEDSINVKTALEDGEIMISLLTQDFDGDPAEEQILAYRNLLEIDSPIYITYIDYDEPDRTYKRIWSAPTAAARPGTISLFTQDLIGDRSVSVLLTGMNGAGEHTMTIFRKNGRPQPNSAPDDSSDTGQPFTRIAELRIDGSISVQETERPQAYQLGMSRGQSFTIAAYGHDFESDNILDQVEIIYAYNPASGLYEQQKITRIPGSQIEQRRLRELLSGAPGVFESFINDLWYYVSPQGTVDNRQYIFFDPAKKELIFFGDETQQIFIWQNSSPTRYGLYISSQNISVSTLRRFLDIELESLDSIRVKVFEDVRLKIGVNASWDGSYRRAGTIEKQLPSTAGPVNSYIDALYDSSLGKIRFFKDGVYELNSGGTVKKGRYAFLLISGQEILEFRPDHGSSLSPDRTQAIPAENSPASTREIYQVEASPPGEDGGEARKTLSLSRVRLGAMGIQSLHEPVISLTAAEG